VILGARNLIRDGVIDDDGAPVKLEGSGSSFRLAESMPPMDATFLAWNYMGGSRDAARMVFHYLTTTAWAAVAKADVLLCNTFPDLEPGILAPDSPAASVLPIGPLRTCRPTTGGEAAPLVGHFWRADGEACLSFLDAQPQGGTAAAPAPSPWPRRSRRRGRLSLRKVRRRRRGAAELQLRG